MYIIILHGLCMYIDYNDNIIPNFFFSELKAEVLRLRGVREGYERQLGVCPRKLVDRIESNVKESEEIERKQEEINRLKEQLKKTEEQLAATQK